jgi:tetratricopeptide (TPR) repeat protein
MEAIEEAEVSAAPLAPPPVTVADDELELVDLDSTPILAEQDEALEMVEPEMIAVDAEPAEAFEVTEEVPVTPDELETIPAAAEAPEISTEAIAALAAADVDEEEPVVPQVTEQDATISEPPAADQPETVPEVSDEGDLVAAPTPVATMLPMVRLTLEAYADRLNKLEDRQRALLTQAIARRDDALRDRLQRELVIMNDRLALLADSYVEELACYQHVLETLEQLRDEVGEQAGLETAIDQLRNGETDAAEAFLADLSEQPSSFNARAAHGSGQLAECRVDLQKALGLYRQAVEQEPDNPRYLHAAGRTARSLYNYREALPWLESFVRLSRQNGGNDPLGLALAQRELAYTYVLSGQYQKAGPLYKEAMTVLARKLGQDHPEMATSWRQIGELQETLGEYDKAVSLYKKALEILEKKRGPEHPVLASILVKLAALCMELEMEKEAVPLYERLVRIQEKALRPTHPQRALSLTSLAESYRLQGRYADAFACYQKSLAINEALHGAEHPSVAAILQELAKLCTSQRQPEEAKQYQDRASAIFQKSVEASEKKSGQEALTLEL